MDPLLGKLIVISGPSGAGKTTVVRELLRRCPLPLVLSVSATTRAARPGEQDGSDYHFLSDVEFQRRRAAGEFLECVEVYTRGHWYGTLRDSVQRSQAAGRWVILEIDVQGMREVLRQFPEAITIFIRPSTLEELERRLRGRGTENPETLARRLEVARQEFDSQSLYDHVVVNQTVDQAVEEICQFLKNKGAYRP